MLIAKFAYVQYMKVTLQVKILREENLDLNSDEKKEKPEKKFRRKDAQKENLLLG